MDGSIESGRPSPNTVLFFRGRPSLNTVLLWLRPSPNTQFSAHPPMRSAIFGDVYSSLGLQEPSSAKWLSPSFLSMKNATFKPYLSKCHNIPLTKPLLPNLICLLIIINFWCTEITEVPSHPAPPNIVFILFDDVGWADFGYNSPGQSSIPTPNIDRMAKQGWDFC